MTVPIQYWQPFGDRAVRVVFGNDLSPTIHRGIRQFCLLLQKEQVEGLIEWVPTYTAVTIYYDVYRRRYEDMVKLLRSLEKKMERMPLPSPRRYEIPVCYEGEWAPDLADVAAYHDMEPETVVRLHSQSDYLVYMLGFSPGFPYLGGMSHRIATPRLKVPRKTIPAGSVGIAGEQTGIYPSETPGGWRLIGRTPVPLFDVEQTPPAILEAGDILRFVPISGDEYESLQRKVRDGRYSIPLATEKEGRYGSN